MGKPQHDVLQEIIKQDRKSTRLNSSHGYISYAVFCLKKKKTLFLGHAVGSFASVFHVLHVDEAVEFDCIDDGRGSPCLELPKAHSRALTRCAVATHAN